jgi:ElaB/YqjD/DUF883 family membrane-anchored ribosome-binding protein
VQFLLLGKAGERRASERCVVLRTHPPEAWNLHRASPAFGPAEVESDGTAVRVFDGARSVCGGARAFAGACANRPLDGKRGAQEWKRGGAGGGEVSAEDRPSIGEIGDRVREDLALLAEAAVRRRDEIVDGARRFVDERPLTAVGLAFAAGYALSGALVGRFTLRLVGLGARFALGRLVRGLAVDGAVAAILDGRAKEPT